MSERYATLPDISTRDQRAILDALVDDAETCRLTHRGGLERTGAGICGYLDQEPVIDTHYAVVDGWHQGDRRPALADEDPAVNAAIGRCATWRLRGSFPGPTAVVGRLHPAPCGWCEYPLLELLLALSWGVWRSRLVVSETRTWRGRNGSSYTRPGRHGVYEHPAWAAFAALSPEEQTARVMAVIAAATPHHDTTPEERPDAA